MLIVIDSNSALPNYQQIQVQIKKHILNGSLVENEQLPSIRNLSKELNVAIVTVKRAYEELEKEGFIYTQSGKGVFVKKGDINQLKKEVQIQLSGQLKAIVEMAKYFGFSADEIDAMIERIK